MLVTAVMARNEADRDLERVLSRCLEFSDSVLLLDDRSSDSTPKIARSLGCQVRGRSILKEPAWGHEAPARAELWNWAAEVAGDGWVLVCDADMLLHGDPRDLTKSWELNSWAFILFDAWSETEFRCDGPWAAGPQIARPWMFKPSACPNPVWNVRGIHTGHAPQNFPLVMGVAPPDTYYFVHRAYATPERRKAKYEQYLSQASQLSQAEMVHARSIADT